MDMYESKTEKMFEETNEYIMMLILEGMDTFTSLKMLIY